MTSTAPVEASTSYRVNGVGHRGGHSRIRCNSTDVEADTASFSDGFRPGPAELLCASLAACLLKSIERFSQMLPIQYEKAAVEVEAFRQDAPPKMTRMRYRIEIATDEPEHRVDLLHRNIRKYGTITNTLDAACELTGEIVARRSNEGGLISSGAEDVSPAVQGALFLSSCEAPPDRYPQDNLVSASVRARRTILSKKNPPGDDDD